MDAYNHYRNCGDINNILDNINNMLPKEWFVVCHGRYHTLSVVDKTEYILRSLSCDERTVELGKIAALLHDIGNIAGRWEHARKGAALASVLMDYPVQLMPDEKETIVQAIADHSSGANISSVIGAALIIADKTCSSRKRLLPLHTDTNETAREAYKKEFEMEDVILNISDKVITVDFIVTGCV